MRHTFLVVTVKRRLNRCTFKEVIATLNPGFRFFRPPCVLPTTILYRWSADDAVDYLVRVSGVPRSKAEFDVRRIVTFPGQAVAPEYGHLKLDMLRRLARSAIGMNSVLPLVMT